MNSNEEFNKIIHTDKEIEFWYAREPMPLLGYERWENFDNAVNRAMESCETAGKGAKRNGKDYMLTRYACYLIAQNSDVKTVT